ncbi:MAG: DUF4238 domain-containing protein [Aphanizomenon gracile PMC644.10]|nr:DUF4238 domain-containing protein [Aphanizomenon gracile PMC644.10]
MNKRKHHYVPKFYLKRFASDLSKVDPRQINLYNIPSCQIKLDISLRDQCYKRKFYGQTDEIENLLSTLEGTFSSVVKKICETKTVPTIGTQDHHDLLIFISTQMMRTSKCAEDLNNRIDMFTKMILSRDSRFSEVDLNKVKIGFIQPVLASLENSAEMAFGLDDLGIHLFRAAPNTEFITSDNPVFKYNMYCEKFGLGTTGIASLGLLIFLPLSPEICLLLYDNSIYKVGQKNNHNISVITADDVRQINAMQFINAETNLYFSSNISRIYFNQTLGRYSKSRKDTGERVTEFEEIGNPLRTLVMTSQYIPNLKLNLSPMSIVRDAKRVPLEKRLNQYRREMPDIHEDNNTIFKCQEENGNKERVFKRVRDSYQDPVRFSKK